MFFIRVLVMAVRSLWIHPMRTVLATLGVIIGVGAVVSAMAILEGMRASLASRFETMGSKKIFITPAINRRNERLVGNFDSLKLDDAEAITKSCDAVQHVMPQVGGSVFIKFRSKSTNASLLGATEIYANVNNHHVREGVFLSRANLLSKSRVVVLGSSVKRELFGGRPALDETIKLTGLGMLGVRTFTVIGVMEEKGNIGFTDVDRQIIIPVTTAMDRVYGLDSIQAIIAESITPAEADIEKAKEQIKKLLRQRHKVRAGKQDDFQIRAQREFVQSFGLVTKITSIVLGSIAGISLVVGGIGIMNIMLVSVTERTREIGVRMAMGAQRSDVMKQFLIEASIVSFFGGAIGVLMGWGLAGLIERVTRIFEPVTTSWSVMIALLMATCIGIISGLYPAWKASRLDPVEALRYE